MGFSRHEYWSGLPRRSPGDLPNPGMEPRSPAVQVDSLPTVPPGKPMNSRVDRLSLLQGNSQLKNQTRVSCIAGGFFASWTTWEALKVSFEVQSLSRVQLFVTQWTVAYHAPLSIGFSRQEYWSGLPFPSPEDLPNPGIEPGSPAL